MLSGYKISSDNKIFIQTSTDVLPIGIIPSLVPSIPFCYDLFQVRSVQIINDRECQRLFYVFYNRNRYGPSFRARYDGREKKINICQRSPATETVTHICAIDSKL